MSKKQQKIHIFAKKKLNFCKKMRKTAKKQYLKILCKKINKIALNKIGTHFAYGSTGLFF